MTSCIGLVEVERLLREAYCNDYFRTKNFKLIYGKTLIPIVDTRKWMESVKDIVVKSSRQPWQAGRSRKRCIRSRGEGKELKCSKCGGYDHNRSTCNKPTYTFKFDKHPSFIELPLLMTSTCLEVIFPEDGISEGQFILMPSSIRCPVWLKVPMSIVAV